MATFTITANVNIDTLVGKTGGDAYTLSNGFLTIDQDSRYGLNQTTSTSLGIIGTTSGKLGDVLIDGRKIRLIPFNNGSGTLPTLNSLVTQGSASGKLLGVWTALNAAPVTSGAMPASGWIKIKQWNDVPFASGALTLSGVTATATGPDIVGWIEIVGDANAQFSLTYGGVGSILGEWYEVGATTGDRTTAYQLPTSGSLLTIGGVFVQSSEGSASYDRYPNIIAIAGVNTVATDAVRGKWCYVDINGVLRLGSSDGSNYSGFCPPANRKIRIGNVIVQTCTTAARTANIGFTGANAFGTYYRLDGMKHQIIDKASLGIQIHDTYIYGKMTLSNCSFVNYLKPSLALASSMQNIIVGCTGVDQGVALTLKPAIPLTVDGLSMAFYSLTTSWWSVASIENATGLVLNDLHLAAVKVKTGARHIMGISTSRDITITNSTFGSGGLSITTLSGVRNLIQNIGYYNDVQGVDTTSTYGLSVVTLITGVNNLTIDNIHFPAGLNSHCYNGMVYYGVYCSNIKLRNIGTEANPVNLGTANISMGAFQFSYNLNMNIGLKFDRIYTTAGRGTPFSDYSLVNATFKGIYNELYPVYRGEQIGNNTYLAVCGSPDLWSPNAVGGTHWLSFFTSATAGAVMILFNATTPESAPYFVGEGASHFGGSSWTLWEGQYGYITAECPHWIKGYTAFTSITYGTWPYALGTITATYQIDTGAGFGAWTPIANVSSEVIDPAIGFRIKIKGQSNTADRTSFGGVALNMVTTTAAQRSAIYPLDVSTLQISSMVSGSMVKVSKTSDETVLYAGSATSIEIEYAGEVRVVIRKGTGSPAYKQWDTIVTLVSGETTAITALQELDE